jgi:squalene synthase HpnC
LDDVYGTGLRTKERAENFPVALRILPAELRRDLRAVYDVLRTIDDLGDEADGNRVVRLLDFRADLSATFAGGDPLNAVLVQLLPTISSRELSADPFRRLIQANLIDQQNVTYHSLDDVLSYCELSAVPVGRLVLQIFGQSTSETRQLSDRVCSALQLLEHWQDIGEDRRAGRIYLPRADMARFGVTPADLDQASANSELRRLIMFETARAQRLLESGAGLTNLLTGWAKVAVAGYIAGGRATVAALRRAGGDSLRQTPRPRRRDVLVATTRQLVGAER